MSAQLQVRNNSHSAEIKRHPSAQEDRGNSPQSNPSPIRLILVARHPLLRRGIAQALEQEPPLAIVEEADRLGQALLLAQRVSPDVVLLDASACDEDAWVQVKAIRSRHPQTVIVLLTGPDHDNADLRLQTFVTATILRSVEPTALAAALQSIVAGRAIEGAFSEAAGAAALPQLTPREREVLMAICRGLTNRAIARALWLSEHTVKFHVSSLYRKLGVKTRAEAATWLLENGVSPVERHPGPRRTADGASR